MNYFENETACKCGCGDKTSPILLNLMNTARYLRKKPIFTNRFYSCPTHNKNIGGSSTSSHIKGLAVDIQLRDKAGDMLELTEILLKVGFRRLCLYRNKNLIHADIDTDKPEGIFII